MDDVIFAHKLRLLDVAARLRQLGSHALQPCAIVGSEHSGLLFAVRPIGRSVSVLNIRDIMLARNVRAYIVTRK